MAYDSLSHATAGWQTFRKPRHSTLWRSSDAETMAGVCSSVDLVVRGAWMDWRSHLSRGATDPRSRRHERWSRNYRFRKHQRRTERLAIAGRHGARLDLGPRQLRRSGLDRRLAPARANLHPGSVGARSTRQSLRSAWTGTARRATATA